jgi:hypothetical protein
MDSTILGELTDVSVIARGRSIRRKELAENERGRHRPHRNGIDETG